MTHSSLVGRCVAIGSHEPLGGNLCCGRSFAIPEFRGRKSRGVRTVGGSCRRRRLYPEGHFDAGSDLGGIRSASDEAVKWEQA